MAKIIVECADPNDLDAVEAAAEQYVGRCDVTYYKQSQALQEVGTVTSERKAAEFIAEETGEKPDTVRKMIQRGKTKVETPVPKETTIENDDKKMGIEEKKGIDRPVCNCGKPVTRVGRKKDGSPRYDRLCWRCREDKGKNKPADLPLPVKDVEIQTCDQKQQLHVWKTIDRKLSSIAEYALQNCESPSGVIDNGLRLRILSAIDTINMLIKAG